MKAWLKRILITAAVLAVTCGAWLLGYHTRKNPDNIPSKEILLSYWAEHKEDYALSCIEGFSRDILTMIWQEPDGQLFGFYGDIWTTENGDIIVCYDETSKVQNLRCRLPDADPVVIQSIYSGTITDILTESDDPSAVNNVLQIQTDRGEILYFTLVEESNVTGTLSVGKTASITCEEYNYAGFLPVIDITIP